MRMSDLRRNLPPLSALAAFEAAARLSSFTKAGQDLGVSQAAVSRQIKALEGFLETQVFHRLHRGVRLTPEGERLQAAVNMGLGHIAEVVGDLQRQGGGAVTIASTISFAAFWLMPRTESFRDKHPDIDLKFLTAEHFVDVAREKIDLAIRFGHGNWPGLQVTPLFHDEVIAVCAPGYLASRSAPRDATDLLEERLLHLDISDSSWISWGHWLRQQGVAPRSRLHGPRFNNYTLIIQAALAGQGFALGWRQLIRPHLEAGTLVPVTPERLETPNAYHLVSQPLANLAPAVMKARDWILAEAGVQGIRAILRQPTDHPQQRRGLMSLDQEFLKAFHAHRKAGDLFHQGRHDAHEIFQTSTIDALLEGIYDGEMTFEALARHGDFGLGTFNALDGEMTAIDGAFYQITSDGRVHPVSPEMKTPFAVVMFFDPTLEVQLAEPTDFDDLAKALDAAVPSRNIFYAVKATGHFDALQLRSVPRQAPPYRPLVEVVKDQGVFELQDVEGVLSGFRFPDYTKGINVPGYHLHFLTADKTAGGHVTGFTASRAKVEIDITADFHMELPESGAFLSADLTKDSADAIDKVEK